MAIPIVEKIEITNAGGAFTISTSPLPPDIVWIYSSSSVVLANDVTIDFDTIPTNCNTIFAWAYGSGDLDIDIYNFQINGQFYGQEVFNVPSAVLGVGSDVGYQQIYIPNLSALGALSGAAITDNTISLAKLTELASARIIVGNSSNRPTAVAMSGDVTISNTGVTAIGSGVIVDADVNNSAAIARSKLGNGTADYVVINSGAGAFSEEAQLANSRGGTGLNSSASTGFATVNAGTWSVGAMTDDRDLQVSWETGLVGDFKIKWDFDGTCTGIYAFLTKAIGAANATITPKNQAGTTLTSGVITFTASDPKGTAQTVTPSGNNTFVAGDVWTFTTAGGSAAGYAQLSIAYTRTS